MNHFRNFCLFLFGILAPLFVLEITLRSLVGEFPLRYHKYLHTDVRILAQSSKNGLVPRNYVAFLGDSYAAGWGDWYFTAIDLDPFGNPPFHSVNVIHELTGVDVVSFAQPGTGSFHGIVYNPIKYYEMLRSRGFSLSPPSKIIIYFYEGNDFEDNLTFLGRYWNSTEKDYTMKNMHNLFDEIFVRGPLVEGKISDRVIKYMKNLEIMKNLYVAKVIYILGRDVIRLFSQQENVEVPIAEVITSFNIGGESINISTTLETPPLNLDNTEVRKALLVFEGATSYLMKYFDESDVMVVYIPSPLSSYEIDSEFVNVRRSDGQSRLYEKDYVYQRSDELCSYIASIAQKLGAEFLDLRVSIRARARHELVHGPQDWEHFNRVGYEVFGETVAKRLRKGAKDQADRGRFLTALMQPEPASYGFDMPACSGTVTTLKPGDDIQSAVNAAPEGATFVLEPGVYRQQSVTPKNRQKFLAKDGAILNGSMVLTGWRREAIHWVAEGLPSLLRPSGVCRGGGNLCQYREDLFVDGTLYKRVNSLDELGPGQWYYDNNTAYLTDDPSGKAIELGVTKNAFGGNAKGVVLNNLIVERYASEAQHGVIDAREGAGWVVINVTARWNHGIGLYIGEGMHVVGGSFSHNGQMGMGGKGDGALIENVEIAFNNYAGFSPGWEAGGTKFVRSDSLTIRNSCVHHNAGPGLWTDIDNINIVIEDNKVFDNSGDGIKHEISYKATIRNNKVARNGKAKDNWLWGSQILIQNSSSVEVYGNIVEVAAEFGNGISMIYQDRGRGEFGPRVTAKNNVHHNQIIHLGAHGRGGMVADFDGDRFWNEQNNRFDWNNYVVADPDGKFWAFHGHFRNWSYVQDNGLERNGTLTIEEREPMKLSCDN